MLFAGGLAGENVAMESLLPIVASQRERFKIRNMELEAVSYLFLTKIQLIVPPKTMAAERLCVV